MYLSTETAGERRAFRMWARVLLAGVLAASLILSGCGNDDTTPDVGEGQPLPGPEGS